MDILPYLHALLLGIVEGITEFLPVSSTGHLILLIDLLKFEGPPGKVFEVVIQLGAILAVCWYYRRRLWQLSMGVWRDGRERYFAALLLVAFLPAMVIGALAHDFIKTALFSPRVVAVMLIVGGIAILLIERFRPAPRYSEPDRLPLKTAFLIGLFQCLAMIPGTSRSGATIMGSLLLGLERRAAAEFSFLLAIPTMLAATVYDVYKNAGQLSGQSWELIGIGFLAAFFAALLSVRALLAFLGRHGFAPFAVYRIALGALMLWLLAG